jgi:hypothetical protein
MCRLESLYRKLYPGPDTRKKHMRIVFMEKFD